MHVANSANASYCYCHCPLTFKSYYIFGWCSTHEESPTLTFLILRNPMASTRLSCPTRLHTSFDQVRFCHLVILAGNNEERFMLNVHKCYVGLGNLWGQRKATSQCRYNGIPNADLGFRKRVVHALHLVWISVQPFNSYFFYFNRPAEFQMWHNVRMTICCKCTWGCI